MASFNRVVLVGNLTRDVDLRYIPSGTAVADIGMAISERVKKNNEWVNETVFVDVTLWGRIAEVASEYLSKGSSVLIEGRLRLDTWEQDGQKRSKLKVVADQMQMLGGKGGGGGSGGAGRESGSASRGGSGSDYGDSGRGDSGRGDSGRGDFGRGDSGRGGYDSAPANSRGNDEDVPF